MKYLMTLSIFQLCILSIILYFLCIIADKFRNYKVTKEEILNSFPAFCKFIDHYYISNKIRTIGGAFIYIFGTSIIFLIVRSISLGYITNILKFDSTNLSNDKILIYLLYYILFLLCIFLYKVLLQILFYEDVLKLRIYLHKFDFFSRFHYLLNYEYGNRLNYICGFIWMLLYRIITKTYDPYLFEKGFDYWYNKQINCFEHQYEKLYQNKYVQKFAKQSMKFLEKCWIVSILIYPIIKIFKILHWYNNCFKFFPYAILFLVFLYDLYKLELYHVYYVSFILFIFYIIKTYQKFETSLDQTNIIMLNCYFYENTNPYEMQRLFILNEENYYFNKNSNANSWLFDVYHAEEEGLKESFVTSIFDGLKEKKVILSSEKQFNYMFLRNTIVFSLIIIAVFFIIKHKILNIEIFNIFMPIYIILLPLIIILFLAKKIFYIIKLDDEYTVNEAPYDYYYNWYYNIIFWMLTILQSYLFWLVLLKPEITFLQTNVLIEMPYNILKISRIFTIEEKIIYLYQYFDYYAPLWDKLDPTHLRHIIRQIDYKLLINNATTLQDIQIYIKMLIENYYLNEAFIDAYKALLADLYEKYFNKKINPWALFFRNVMIIGALITTMLNYNNLCLIFNQLNNPQEVQLLIKKIYLDAFHKKITMDQFITLMLKLLFKR